VNFTKQEAVIWNLLEVEEDGLDQQNGKHFYITSLMNSLDIEQLLVRAQGNDHRGSSMLGQKRFQPNQRRRQRSVFLLPPSGSWPRCTGLAAFIHLS